nr:hypothetical protein OH837_32680 [Streptomyces canus]
MEEHQRRTVNNFLELRSLAPDLRIAPVIQGNTVLAYVLRTKPLSTPGVFELCRSSGVLKDDQVLGKHGLRVARPGGQRFSKQCDRDRFHAKSNGHGDPVISIERPELLVEPKVERCQDPALSDVNRQRIQMSWCVDKRGADSLAIDRSVSHDESSW